MRRTILTLLGAAALSAASACDRDLCGCPPERPTFSGRWVGRTAARDSFDLTFQHEGGASVFTGSGVVVPGSSSSGTPVPVTVSGLVNRASDALIGFTITGWLAAPVDFVVPLGSGGDYSVNYPMRPLKGTLHVRGGGTAALELRPAR